MYIKCINQKNRIFDMKKLLLMLAAMGCMMVANAQVKLSVNGESYAPGATIAISIEEENIYEMDYVGMVVINVINEGSKDLSSVSMTAKVVDAPGYSVKSMCAGICQEGETSPAFDIPANGTYESIFAEFKIHPEQMAADKKGKIKLQLNGVENSEFFLELTYVPMNNGIDDVELGGVKVWPNPVMNELHVACEGAS